MLCMRRTSGFLAMVSDFFKCFFHSRVTEKASHPFPLGFTRTLGRTSPNMKTRQKIGGCWKKNKLLMFVVEGAPGSALGPGFI